MSSIGRAAKLSIRLARHGCANRPFYHIVVMRTIQRQHELPIEQLGVMDPMPNDRNEKIVSFNLERIKYWIAHDAHVSVPVADLLGLSGFFPVHPTSYMYSWRNRRRAKEEADKVTHTEKEGEQPPESS